jgi:hypothetical protein
MTVSAPLCDQHLRAKPGTGNTIRLTRSRVANIKPDDNSSVAGFIGRPADSTGLTIAHGSIIRKDGHFPLSKAGQNTAFSVPSHTGIS